MLKAYIHRQKAKRFSFSPVTFHRNERFQIVERYDIIMIQEIRNKDGTAIEELVARVNDHSLYHYGSVVIPRTRRTSSKKQYGYIYR